MIWLYIDIQAEFCCEINNLYIRMATSTVYMTTLATLICHSSARHNIIVNSPLKQVTILRWLCFVSFWIATSILLENGVSDTIYIRWYSSTKVTYTNDHNSAYYLATSIVGWSLQSMYSMRYTIACAIYYKIPIEQLSKLSENEG